MVAGTVWRGIRRTRPGGVTGPPTGLPVPAAEPPPGYVAQRLRQARVAVDNHAGVGLYAIVQSIRGDGYPELADAIVHDLVERVVQAAATDPVVFAQLLAALRSATPAGGGHDQTGL